MSDFRRRSDAVLVPRLNRGTGRRQGGGMHQNTDQLKQPSKCNTWKQSCCAGGRSYSTRLMGIVSYVSCNNVNSVRATEECPRLKRLWIDDCLLIAPCYLSPSWGRQLSISTGNADLNLWRSQFCKLVEYVRHTTKVISGLLRILRICFPPQWNTGGLEEDEDRFGGGTSMHTKPRFFGKLPSIVFNSRT